MRLFRSRRKGAFTPREIRRFERLVPHLGCSIEVAHNRARVQQLSRIMANDAIRPGTAFCVVDEALGVLHTGCGGEALIGIDRGVGRRLALDAFGGKASRRHLLEDGRELVAMRIAEEPADSPCGLAGPLCLLVAGAERRPAWLARSAAQALGLTAAEARLLEALCMAEPSNLKAAASRLGIGRETAKTQIRGIFHKAGVNRQADLLRQVLLGAAARVDR